MNKITYEIIVYVLPTVPNKVKIYEYLNNCSCIKNTIDNWVIVFEDKIANTIVITSSSKKKYYLVFLLILFPIIFIVVYKCCVTTELTFWKEQALKLSRQWM